MAKGGLLGKIIDGFTTNKQEERDIKARGDRHGGLLGLIERYVTPDKARRERAEKARRGKF